MCDQALVERSQAGGGKQQIGLQKTCMGSLPPPISGKLSLCVQYT
jgi:hypothetical protein